MKSIFIILITFVFCLSLHADWELSTTQLTKMISHSDVIVEGKFLSNKKIKVSDPIKGPQRLSKIKLTNIMKGITLRRSYILFLKLKNKEYSIIFNGTIKSDILVKARVREYVMRERVDASVAVVIGKVLETQKTPTGQKGESYVVAKCEVQKNLKGDCSKNFEVIYKTNKERPKKIFLFRKLHYVFFLNTLKTSKPKTSTVKYAINHYDGALIDRSYILKEALKACSVSSQFEEIAGKTHNGIKIFGQGRQSIFEVNDSIMINLLIQNISNSTVEICNSHIPYLLAINIIDVEKNILVLKNSIKPFEKLEKHFVTLQANRYVVIPPLDLKKYKQDLPPGKYGVYIQLNMPISYARSKANAWVGKILTNLIEFEIKG